MRLSVFGMGYVGTVSAACLASRGHTVICVDNNPSKVELLAEGRSPIVEKDVESLLQEALRCGRLRATTDPEDAVSSTELSIVCVGTPSKSNGSLNLDYVDRVCEEIGSAVLAKSEWHDVVMRSTMLPGSTDSIVLPALTRAGAKEGEHFGLCINPEFLREGTAVADFLNPPKTVIGRLTNATAARVAELFDGLPGPVLDIHYKTAETAKYIDNVWHALKVGFANEVGRICRSNDIDSRDVMEVFKSDTKLNISDKYLSPGFAFGGSCLPKDVRAITYHARRHDVAVPIIESIISSNQRHIEHGIEMVKAFPGKNVGILGFAFKAGTDDLRESPIVTLIEHLLGKGYNLKVFDRNVNLSFLSGANREMLLQRIPHITELMVDDADQLLETSDVIVIGNDAEEIQTIPSSSWNGKKVVDLVGAINDEIRRSLDAYSGPGW